MLALVSAAVFATVVGAKLSTIARYGFDIPFWDEWELGHVFVGLHDRTLTWATLLSPHLEHRVFLGRVLALVLQALNGQWDSRLQMVVDGLLHALAAVALAAAASRSARKAEVLAIGALVTVLAAVPFARENVVWGFESVFYLDLLFSLAGIGLATDRPPLSPGWLLGLACASLAIFTLGSGGFAAAAIAFVAALEAARTGPGRVRAALGAALAGAVAAVAIAAVPRVPGHAPIAAHRIGEFLLTLARCAAWPAVEVPALAIVMWLPLIVLTVGYFRARAADTGSTSGDAVLIGFGVWALLHAPAIALKRGAVGRPTAGYYDLLSVGLVVNMAAAMALVRRTKPARAARLVSAAFAAWLLLASIFGYRAYSTIRGDLAASAEHRRHQIENVRRFLLTGDIENLRGKPFLDVPYPVAEPLVHMLSMPYIKEFLPPSLRAPADLTARETGAFSWVPDGGADPSSGAWSSAAKGGGPFRSQPLAGSRFPYLSFECHGDPAGEGRFLGSEEQSGTAHAVVPLAAAASKEWRRWSVPHPGPGGQIVAFADPPFAFRKPVELGRLTFWSERLLRHGGTIKTAGLLAALFALALTIWARRPFVSRGLEPSGQGEFDGPGASVAISTSTNRTGTSAR